MEPQVLEEAEGTARPRFSGSHIELADALDPHVVSLSWLRYQECAKIQETKIIKELIIAQGEMLWSIVVIIPNLSIPKLTAQNCMEELYERKKFECESEAMKQDWIMTMANRLRCIVTEASAIIQEPLLLLSIFMICLLVAFNVSTTMASFSREQDLPSKWKLWL